MLRTYPRTSRSSSVHNWQLVVSNVCEVQPPARMRQTKPPLDKRSDMFPLHDDRQHAFGSLSANANSVYPRTSMSLNASPAIGPSGGARRDRTDDLMLAKHALSQLSYGPISEKRAKMVGLGRLELPTSRLSSARSNQLSYKPELVPLRQSRAARPWRRKRNEDGGCPARSA